MLHVHSKQAQSQSKDNPQFIQSHAVRKFSFQLASGYELHLKISVGKRTEAKVHWWQALISMVATDLTIKRFKSVIVRCKKTRFVTQNIRVTRKTAGKMYVFEENVCLQEQYSLKKVTFGSYIFMFYESDNCDLPVLQQSHLLPM